MVYCKQPERFSLLGQAHWLGRIYSNLCTALLPGKPLNYSGIIGLLPFQSLYQRPTSLWAYLPRTLEWKLLGLVMLVLALLTDIRLLVVGASPLLITVIRSAVLDWRATVDPRFKGMHSRLLISHMILVDPVVRSIERYKWKRKVQTRKKDRSKSKLIAKDFFLPLSTRLEPASWTDFFSERVGLLQEVIKQLKSKKYFARIHNGWSRWGFRVQPDLWCWCYLLSAPEVHAGHETLHRLSFSFCLLE